MDPNSVFRFILLLIISSQFLNWQTNGKKTNNLKSRKVPEVDLQRVQDDRRDGSNWFAWASTPDIAKSTWTSEASKANRRSKVVASIPNENTKMIRFNDSASEYDIFRNFIDTTDWRPIKMIDPRTPDEYSLKFDSDIYPELPPELIYPNLTFGLTNPVWSYPMTDDDRKSDRGPLLIDQLLREISPKLKKSILLKLKMKKFLIIMGILSKLSIMGGLKFDLFDIFQGNRREPVETKSELIEKLTTALCSRPKPQNAKDYLENADKKRKG